MGWADQITKVFILKWSTTYKVIPKLYTALRASAEMVPNPISAFDSIGPREVWSQRNFVPPHPQVILAIEILAVEILAQNL